MLSLSRRVGRRIAVDARADTPPTRVGRYRLCFELASGGMAAVCLGYEEAPASRERFAAIKLIHPHLAKDPELSQMFADEAEIASRIRHPNVCSVYDFDASGERPYLAMEYLLGESMFDVWRKLSRSRAEDGAHTARRVCKALADACEGLHAAHELTDAEGEPLGIVHRDVSPGNIMLTFDGVAKVVDFGVAAAAHKRHRTQTGVLKGKLAYIAPECLRGERADRRSDVWGIGVVAWELVTGQRLFRRGSDVDTLRAVLEAPIPAPSEVRPGLPKELDDVILLALERDRDDRYETARDLGRDLARVASQGEVVTSSDLAEWLERLVPGARERKEQLLALASQMADVASDAEVAPVTPTITIAEPTPPDHEAPSAEPAEAADERPSEWRRWAVAVALGTVVGLASGSATYAMNRGSSIAAAPPLRAEAPPAAAAPPSDGTSRPELRLRAGSGIARGPYLLELVESDADELLLRIRLDEGEPATEPPQDGAQPRSRTAAE